MKTLILAYACEPGAGSESGVGWLVPTIMAKRHPEHEIYVLTRSRYREKIIATLDSLLAREGNGGLTNIHFLFYEIPSCLLYKDEKGSNWGEQYNYLLWQWFAKGFIKKQNKNIGFDVIHHLTFNQYRTPSPGFFINVPFVMGPIGGAESIADAFYQDLSEHTAKKECFRKKGYDLKLFGWWAKAKNNKKIILCSTKENVKRLKPHCGDNECKLMPAIAYTPEDFAHLTTDGLNKIDSYSPFTLIYAGRAIDWKGIRIFLRAAKRAYIDNGITDFLIKLIGIRSEQEQQMVMGWVKEEQLTDNVELIPFIARADLLKELAKCNLSVYPAFRDSGSMSVLEASALACPTICFDAGGQDAFPDEILLKVKVDGTYEDIMRRFALQLQMAYNDPATTRAIGLKAKEYVSRELVWEKKVDDFVTIYEEITNPS